jgi:hypothetical protein
MPSFLQPKQKLNLPGRFPAIDACNGCLVYDDWVDVRGTAADYGRERDRNLKISVADRNEPNREVKVP